LSDDVAFVPDLYLPEIAALVAHFSVLQRDAALPDMTLNRSRRAAES